MNTYKVITHLGEFFTKAKTALKAKWNIVYRIYGRGEYSWEVDYWEVTPCAQ